MLNQTEAARQKKQTRWIIALAGLCGLIVGLALASPVTRSSAQAGTDAVRVAREALTHAGMEGDAVFTVAPSTLPGFVETNHDGQIIYVSQDGRYVIHGGQVLDVADGVNLTEQSLRSERAAALKVVPEAETLTFAAPSQQAVVTVFTDPDCPFCRAFHKQVPTLNAAGVTVRYLPMPLEIHPDAANKTRAIWCSRDQHEAFNSAFAGEAVAAATAPCDAPIASIQALARKLGVQGTPSIFAPDGTLMNPGLATDPQAFLQAAQGKKG